jgi:uncharacterized repeat protein (TIGR01451 family)
MRKIIGLAVLAFVASSIEAQPKLAPSFPEPTPPAKENSNQPGDPPIPLYDPITNRPYQPKPAPTPEIKRTDPSGLPQLLPAPVIKPPDPGPPVKKKPAEPIKITKPAIVETHRVEPCLSLEMTGPEAANAGQPVEFELTLRNTGKVPVYQVRLESELPDKVRYLGGVPRADQPGDRLQWNIGILDAGAVHHFKMRLQSNDEGELRPHVVVHCSASCTKVTKLNRAKLTLAMTGPETAMVGDEVAFHIKVTNDGSGPLHKVVLRDRLPEGLTHPQGNFIEAELGTLNAGETRSLTLRTKAIRTGRQLNEITATADGLPAQAIQVAHARNGDFDAIARTEVTIAEPGLVLKLLGPASVTVNGEATFQIEVSNPGNAPAQNVKVVDRLPEGLDYIAVSEGGKHDPLTHTIVWNLGTVEKNSKRILVAKARATAVAEGVHTVMAQGEGGLYARSEAPIAVQGVPAVMFEVVDLADPVALGNEAHYEIRVINQGSCPITSLELRCTLSEGMELLEATGPTASKPQGKLVRFEPYARLAVKADLVFRVKARGVKPGDQRFRAQLYCDQIQQPVTKEESTHVYGP